MPSGAIYRSTTTPKTATAICAPIYVDADDNKLKMIPAGSGTTEVEILDASSTQDMSGKTWKPTTPQSLDFSTLVPSTETTGSIMTTKAAWISHSAVGACAIKLLCANAAASGDFATLRIRARADAAGATAAGNFSASAGANDHGDLFALQGYAQPNAYTQATAANIVCGVYACIDRTAGGTSVGRDWSAWIDTHIAVKASGGSYLMRLSHNGSIANDGCFTIYNGGRMPVLFNFEDAAGFLTDSDASKSTAAGAIAVKTPAGTKYIVLYT